MSSHDPRASIVIVNWNAGGQLADTVSSIGAHHGGCVASVAVVDNASTDDSLARLESLGPTAFDLTIVRNPINRGFAAACNQGAALGTSEFILFLNPDTRLFADSLPKAIAFLRAPENAEVGICGIRLVDEAGNTSMSASRFPTLRVMAGTTLGLSRIWPAAFPSHVMSPSELTVTRPVDQVIGAFFLIRRSVFERCGGFDERFFVYFEEVDLSFRAKQLGYASYFLADVTAYHRLGGCSDQAKAARLFYSLRSRILYAQKHYAAPALVTLVLLTAIELPLRLVRAVIRTSWQDFRNTMSAYGNLVSYFFRRA
jgi:GT2 family glycosyltransferase